MHAVVPPTRSSACTPGVIFALRNRNDGVNINQQQPAAPLLPRLHQPATARSSPTTPRSSACSIWCAAGCKGAAQPIREVCQPFNQETEDGRKMEAYSDLLSKAIRSMIEVKEEKDLDSLFTGGKTTALAQHHRRPGRLRADRLPRDPGGRHESAPVAMQRIPPSFSYPSAGRVRPRTLPKNKIYEHSQGRHAAEGAVRHGGGADRLAVQAGAGNHQPARPAAACRRFRYSASSSRRRS